MLREIRFENWKSFKHATLYLDPLTVLIGTNASEKSNTLDGLQLLNRLAHGGNVTSVLAGDVTIKGIRGGLEWACLKPNEKFAIEVVSSLDGNDQIEFLYRIEIIIQQNHALVSEESLTRIKYRPKTRKNPYKINLFWSDPCKTEDPYIAARLYNGKNGTPRPSARTTTILSQLSA
jgi:predicted ATP-dependent endonuclease of OLD family